MDEASPIESNWDELVAAGKEFGKARNLQASAQKFQEAYDLSRSFSHTDDRRAESAYFLAYARYVQKQLRTASTLFKEFLERFDGRNEAQKRCSDICSMLGAIYKDLGELDHAEKYVRRSIEITKEISGSNRINYTFMTSILMRQDRYSEVIPVMEEHLKSLSNDEIAPRKSIMEMLAFANHEINDDAEELKWKKGILECDELLSSDPTQFELPSLGSAPDGWGKDRITHFLETARQNEFATFNNKSEEFKKLLSIDEKFWNAKRNLTLHMAKIAKTKYAGEKFDQIRFTDEEWLEPYFLLRTHASLRGAVRLSLSAQCPEAYALLRSCLENAQYAFYVSTDDSLRTIWLSRHKDDESRNKVREEFSAKKIEKAIKKQNKQLGERLVVLYDETIDHGAHPNVKAFFTNAVQENKAGQLTLSVTYLNPGYLQQVLEHTIEVGEVVLDLFRLVFPDLID